MRSLTGVGGGREAPRSLTLAVGTPKVDRLKPPSLRDGLVRPVPAPPAVPTPSVGPAAGANRSTQAGWVERFAPAPPLEWGDLPHLGLARSTRAAHALLMSGGAVEVSTVIQAGHPGLIENACGLARRLLSGA
jgi:hypothetical protein